MAFLTECTYCMEEIEVDQSNFDRGDHGEPSCDRCEQLVAEGREDEIDE